MLDGWEVSLYTLNSVISTHIMSLLLSDFSSLYHEFLSLVQTTQEVNPHPRIAPCVNMWSATFLFFFSFSFSLCHLLNVGAGICHITREGQVEWTTPHHTTPLKCCTLCYSIMSHATPILYYHASILPLQNSVISRALLVATGVVLWSLECTPSTSE